MVNQILDAKNGAATPKKKGRPTIAEQIATAVAAAIEPIRAENEALKAQLSAKGAAMPSSKAKGNPLDRDDDSAMPGTYGYKWTRDQVSGGVPNDNFLTVDPKTGASVKPDCVFRAVVHRNSGTGFETNYNPRTNERYMPRARFERLKAAFQSGAFVAAGRTWVDAQCAEFGEPITERGQLIAAFYRSK